MIPVAILERYARSLAEVAFETNIEDTVIADLRLFDEIFRAVPDVRVVFDSPAVSREEKEKLLDALLARYPVKRISANFIRILFEQNRIRWFSHILDAFVALVNEHKGIVAASVITATPLTPGDIAPIAARLGKIMGKQVTVAAETDADILGGMVVRVGDMVYDGSIRTRLAQMRQRLTEGMATAGMVE